ncbi:MAG: hypothetical protein A2W61_08555 [Deltaproteobacteria bacterium RIFCSPLOWO2_01_44_7]|nr:MAG: hypothetical protein A2712_09740 [Deltaproteobacteria bacterium RIFCSPHIGHO2_01_FULL_43_49]OGQ15394.1 MAG: hypothetical protein A3D22_10270 [Deltaproteobacteria bacterium RIFCSPHIGHO2_02_FULL_44_53]OGQ29588.1 MAG: hypothetical protein A3D98_10470 [Deltaproteobacteria bacterium RIFCSPHIGHO2_12_FULL_44_21]OGQ32201.1 MAG: hypothetical protein A2979_00115 [Deltaproteobacteria bacterium RIFCSPLOWO2_01_FULL_45_74]OGQ43842.1 MAG: hypothetical protein A3I70_04010 [Deltaproteobacteria bacterium 
MKKRLVGFALSLVGGIALITSCSYVTKVKDRLFGKTVIQDGVEYKQSADQQTVTMTDQKTGEQVVAGEDLKIPDSFPKDLPIYKNAKVTMFATNPPMVSLFSKDDVQTTVAWYQQALPGNGWQVTVFDNSMANLGSIQANKGNLIGSLTFVKDDEQHGTLINLSVVTQEGMNQFLQGQQQNNGN